MNVYIENVTKNIDISIRERTLKPGSGGVFSEEVSKQDGVVAFVKRGWLKIEIVKESPDGVATGIVPAAKTVDPTVNDNMQTGQPVVSGNGQPQSTHTSKKRKPA